MSEQDQVCGWLKDKFGISERAMEAMLKMKKIDMTELEQTHAGV